MLASDVASFFGCRRVAASWLLLVMKSLLVVASAMVGTVVTADLSRDVVVWRHIVS